jgi:hypothetical protein
LLLALQTAVPPPLQPYSAETSAAHLTHSAPLLLASLLHFLAGAAGRTSTFGFLPKPYFPNPPHPDCAHDLGGLELSGEPSSSIERPVQCLYVTCTQCRRSYVEGKTGLTKYKPSRKITLNDAALLAAAQTQVRKHGWPGV